MIARQLLVAAGIVVAVVVLWLAVAGPLHPLIALPPDDPAQRLAFAVKWLLVPGFTLLAGIGVMAASRFFSSDAIDGTRTPGSATLEINLRYNQNTLEQAVLVIVAWPLLALYLPTNQLGLIPVLAVLFGFGRAAFWIGYLIAPWARAFGFALTFYPTAGALVWLLGKAL
jgi:hypothetical protein